MSMSELHQRWLNSDAQADDADDEESEDAIDEYSEDAEGWDVTIDDPGTFKYNKRLLVISLPCFCLVMVVTGEVLMVIAVVGVTMMSVLQSYGEHNRVLVIFMMTFLLSQATILYTVMPLVWVSIANLLLIGLINAYTVMTAVWLVIQLPAFRQQTQHSLRFMEKMLFSFYLGVCICLWTWAQCFVLPVQLAPFMFLLYGFVVLSLFLVPSCSSFKISKTDPADYQIVDPALFGLITALYTAAPIFIHIGVTVFHDFFSLVKLETIGRGVFLVACSLFLATLLSLRKYMDHVGYPYEYVIRIRWTSGLVMALLASPILQAVGVTSHLLPWLPVMVTAHCCYGILLSYRRKKMLSLGCMVGLIMLTTYNMGILPWKLVYYVPITGLHINSVFVLIFINLVLCLMCGYMCTHGSEQLLGAVFTTQTIVFLITEVCLMSLGLYSSTMLVCTGAAGTYLFIRLFQVKKLPWLSAWFSTSCHLTKLSSQLIVWLSSDGGGDGIIRIITLFLMMSFFVYILVFELQDQVSEKEAYLYIGGVYISCAINIHWLSYSVWNTAFSTGPSNSDLIGVWLILAGLLVTGLYCLQLPSLPKLQQSLLGSIVLGAVIICIQPTMANNMEIIQYWSFLLTAPLLYGVISLGPYHSQQAIVGLGAGLSLFPVPFVVSLIYADETSMFLYLMYLIVSSVIMSMYLLVTLGQFSFVKMEQYTLYMYYTVLSALLVFICEAALISGSLRLGLSVPLCFSALTTLAASIGGKILAHRNKDLPQRLIDENGLRARLPVVSNAVTTLTFVLLYLACPFTGFSRDLWVVVSSVSLLCYQQDRVVLTKYNTGNQTTPMLISSICVLIGASISSSAFWELQVTWSSFVGCVELLSILVTIPTYFILWGLLWTKRLILSEKLVIFLSPLNAILLVVASSSSSVMLSGAGLVSGVWMGFKLPMKVDRQQHHHSTYR